MNPVVPVRLPDGRWLVPGNRWDLVPDEARRPDVTVSVIVPYYRERAQLDRVLEGLRLQDLPPDQLEVIVVDDGSPEPLSLDGDQGLATKVLRQEDRGFRAAAARNLGAAAASGGVLCFLDQDTVPEPGYLRVLTRLPSLAPDVLTVGRRRHAELAGWGPEEVRSWLDGTGSAPEELPAPEWLTDGYRSSRALLDADDESYRLVISAVMCCSAELFEAVGGFDETFDQYGGEDWDFAHRAWVAGAVLAHVEQAVAWHDGPDWAGRGDAASQEAEKAREQAALARRIPALERSADSADPDAPRDMVLVWRGTGAMSTGQLRAAVQTLLGSTLDLAVHLDLDDVRRVDLPQIRSTPVAPELLARARCIAEVDRDLVSPRELLRAREALGSDVGRVILAEGKCTLTSFRALNRAQRWQATTGDVHLMDRLFGTVRLV